MAQGSAQSIVGPQGPTGPIGSTGPAGIQGATGVQGSNFYSGQSVLNFGNTPGTNITSTVVVGQSNILTTSTVNAFMMADTTASGAYGHNAEEHKIVPIKLTCGNIVAGTGFTIWGETDWRLDATFIVRWVWSL